MEKIYDLIIIGGGPAGLSAGLYSGRARLDTLLIEKEKEGGLILQTLDVENYPGGVENDTGPVLIDRMLDQFDKFGSKRIIDEIIKVNFLEKIKIIEGNEKTYKSKAVIIASGAKPRLLGCEGEKIYTGKGVSYCATCDAPFFDGLEVFVVGGGDTAIEEAVYLTKFARKVYIIHRRDQLRAAKSIQEKAFSNNKIEFIWNSEVIEIKGENFAREVIVKNLLTGEINTFSVNGSDMMIGVFIFVGYTPISQLFEGMIEMENDYILTDENMKTSLSGVFAAGDIRKKYLRQVITACSDGAIAAIEAEKYLECED